MSKLDELMANLCPNGVEYKELKEIAEMQRGKSLTKANSVSGTYPVISGGREPAFYCNMYNREGDIITVAGSGVGAGYVQFWNKPIFVCDAFSVKALGENLTKYLYYVLQSKQNFIYAMKKGSGVPHVHISSVEKLKIPVPPLEVQREIVRILDNFTELTAELTAELTTELAARKKQYEYYRDMLLNFDDTRGGISWVKLGDIAEIGTGSSNTNEKLEEGLYPFFVRSPEPCYKNEYEFDEIAIITAGDGVGVGKVFHYINGKYALHQRAYRIHIISSSILPKFYFHYMRSAFLLYISKTMYQGSVASIRRPMLNDFPVPIPLLSEQNRIVKILDRFDALMNDLTEELPAEIAARRAQYEYYRDKLLSFEEAKM